MAGREPADNQDLTGHIVSFPGEALPSAAPDGPVAEFAARCDAIEEAYEFMLAYAAQGLPNEQGSASGSQIRDFLRKSDGAMTGLADVLRRCAPRGGSQSLAAYQAFVAIVERDVQGAQAAIQLVLAQPSIGSGIVDNLNGSIHLRAVLTDLFLLDDVLKA
jgi:hypothetical protein